MTFITYTDVHYVLAVLQYLSSSTIDQKKFLIAKQQNTSTMTAQSQNKATTESQEPQKTEIYISNEQAKSVFTLLIYFKNGYTRGCKFHSWKQQQRRWNGNEIQDERYALNRLVMLIEERFKDKYKTAIIYHNPSGTDIITYCYGMMKSKDLFGWTTDTGGNVQFTFKERAATPRIIERKQDEIKFYV